LERKYEDQTTQGLGQWKWITAKRQSSYIKSTEDFKQTVLANSDAWPSTVNGVGRQPLGALFCVTWSTAPKSIQLPKNNNHQIETWNIKRNENFLRFFENQVPGNLHIFFPLQHFHLNGWPLTL
jgi:hypothetical protein